jgi:hypothetical protein
MSAVLPEKSNVTSSMVCILALDSLTVPDRDR